MIETGVALLRLLVGLGFVFVPGYALLAILLPSIREWSRGELAAFSFGVGALALTLWMLTLTWCGLPFSLPLIGGPLLGLSLILLLSPRGRAALAAVRRVASHRPRLPLQGWGWFLAGLLAVLLVFAALRATLYPLWAWDAVATWGCKAKLFYLAQGVHLSRIDAHNYYPNLVPLVLTYLYFCLGQVNDSLVQGVFPLWGALLLTLLYSLALRMGLTRRQALGLTAFFALNGTVFIVHLYIAYADLPLAYFALGATGLLYLWLNDRAPRGSLTLAACCSAGMAWCKYEGAPLAATVVLAALLTLIWLRPPGTWRRIGQLLIPLAGLAAGHLPWRLFSIRHHLEIGADHIQNFYPHQLVQALSYLGAALVNPENFGILWPAVLLAAICSGRRLWTSPRLFLALFTGGNLLAILLAYAVVPASAAEFPSHVRATVDRLLLHITPTAALLVGVGLKDLRGGPGEINSPTFPPDSPPNPL